ncbi:MAG: DUF1257 domain-containing protein [Desulfobacterales bacterium]|nr:DUF1257 domain-containing protein [Desulfobacterales bacterium]
MSCIFIISSAVVAGWPTFCAAAGVAAASLGFKILKDENMYQATEVNVEKKVELDIEGSEVLTDRVRPDDEMIFSKDDIKVHIYKDPRGRCAMHVYGIGKSDEELKEQGTHLIHKIKQQYAYQKVTQELKNKGFSITQEELTQEGRIRLSLRKFE